MLILQDGAERKIGTDFNIPIINILWQVLFIFLLVAQGATLYPMLYISIYLSCQMYLKTHDWLRNKFQGTGNVYKIVDEVSLVFS